MNILIIADHYPVASGRYVLNALKRLGHDARSTGVTHGAEVWGGVVDEKYIWAPSDLEGWTPEFILLMDGNMPAPQLPKAWKDTLVAVYGVDNHVRDYHQFDQLAQRLYLAHGHGFRIDENGAYWLPCGYDPTHFTPGHALAERSTDVAMVGVVYNTRAELLYMLLSGIPGLRAAYGTGAVYDEYAAIYQNAKVSLVRSAANDVAQRVWETAAMGCVVVKDANPDDEALGLEHFVNCLIYQDAAEAVSLVRWVLDHPTESQAIADAGRAWAQSGTWDERCKVIISWAEAQRKPVKRGKARN